MSTTSTATTTTQQRGKLKRIEIKFNSMLFYLILASKAKSNNGLNPDRLSSIHTVMFCVLSPVQLPNNSGAVPPKKNLYRVRIFIFK